MARTRRVDIRELKSLTQFYAEADKLCRQWISGWESLLQEYKFLINSPIDATEVSIHKWEALRAFSSADCGFCLLHERPDGSPDCKNCEVSITCRNTRHKSIADILDVLETTLRDFLEKEEDETRFSEERK